MTPPSVASIRRAMTPAVPSLQLHDELMACRERRVIRALAKCVAADVEFAAAKADYDVGAAERAQFIADNPDPQLSLMAALGDA